MNGWRYLATRLNGDGTETFLSNDVPLQDPAITEDLSGPGGIDGRLSPELERLTGPDGRPLLVPWSTALYAEKDGVIRGGAIVSDMGENGPVLVPQSVGFTGYLQDQPYTGDQSWLFTDPLSIARHIWSHVQGKAQGNLGLAVDGTSSPVRVGLPESPVDLGTVSDAVWDRLMGMGWIGKKDDGKERLYAPEDDGAKPEPFTLSWWKDHDLGAVFDKLAAETPFEYKVEHEWSGETLAHRLRLGYPTLGARLTEPSFVTGINILEIPQVDYDGDDYASEVVVLGAGQGRKMIRGSSTRTTDRLYRAAVVQDKAATTKKAATATAARQVAARLGDPDLSTFVVTDHPNAPLGSFSPGDEILVQTRGGWGTARDIWVRILSITTRPDQGRATVTATRVEKLE